MHVITTIARGGAENQLLSLVKAQIQAGMTVSVVPLKGPLDLMEELSNSGAEVNLDVHDRSPIFSIRALTKIRISNKDSVVHAHLSRAELFVALAGQPTGSITITSRHSADPFWPNVNKALSSLLGRISSRSFDGVIFISHSVGRLINARKEISIRPQQFTVPYGINIQDFQGETVLDTFKNRAPDTLRIGTAARLVASKDLPTLLRAFSIVSQKHPQIELFIAGAGEEEPNLRSLSKSLGIMQKTFWLGQIREVPEFLRGLDIFVLPSLHEALGLVLLESMAAGVITIAARNSAQQEVIQDGSTGFLFETSNAEDLARVIEKVIEHNNQQQIIANAKKRLLEQYSIEKMSEAILGIYTKFASEPAEKDLLE